MEPSFLTKRMPEPSLTSLPQKAHLFGTYISDYRTPSFAGLQNLQYKALDENGKMQARNLLQLSCFSLGFAEHQHV